MHATNEKKNNVNYTYAHRLKFEIFLWHLESWLSLDLFLDHLWLLVGQLHFEVLSRAYRTQLQGICYRC